MAYELTDRAWNAPLEGVCKLVFLALCTRAKDHTGQQHYDCWPGLETIAADCGISERCARSHVQWLIEEGYISRRRRGMLTSLYRIVLDKLKPSETHERQNLPVNPAEFAGHDRQNLHTEPAIEPVTQPVKKPTAATPAARPVVVANEIPENLLADWMLVRKSKGRKVLTSSELDNMRTEAAQAGISLADAVRECINSGWARFKAAWLTNKNPSAPTVPSATPVDAAVLEKMAAPPVAARDVPQLPPEERQALRAEIARINSTPVAKHKLSWAEEAIALRRAGEHISYGRLKMAMDALGLSTWKEVSCAA